MSDGTPRGRHVVRHQAPAPRPRAAAAIASALGWYAASSTGPYGIGTFAPETTHGAACQRRPRALDEPRHDSARPPALRGLFLDDEQAPGAPQRGGERLVVERHEAAQVDDLALDSLGRERLSGRERLRDGTREREDRQIAAGAAHERRAEQRERRHRAATAALDAVERLVLEEEHGVRVADRRLQQQLGVVGAWTGATILMPGKGSSQEVAAWECCAANPMPPPCAERTTSGSSSCPPDM